MEKRFIITALLITLLSVVFSMSGDGGNVPVVKNESENVDNQVADNTNNDKNVPVVNTGTVKDQFGIDTGMTKDELEKFKEDYYSYADKNRITDGIFTDQAYFLKINLLEYSKLAKEYNIFLSSPMDMCSLYDFIIRSELIVKGQYVDFTVDNDKNSKFSVTYQFKIDNIIANETEYATIPEIIKIKEFNLGTSDFDKLAAHSNNIIKKGDQYILFLSRFDFYDFKRAFDEGKTKKFVKDDCFTSYTFTDLWSSTRKVENNRIKIDLEKSVFDKDNWISIDELENISKKLSEINDKPSFYKRSYK